AAQLPQLGTDECLGQGGLPDVYNTTYLAFLYADRQHIHPKKNAEGRNRMLAPGMGRRRVGRRPAGGSTWPTRSSSWARLTARFSPPSASWPDTTPLLSVAPPRPRL